MSAAFSLRLRRVSPVSSDENAEKTFTPENAERTFTAFSEVNKQFSVFSSAKIA